MKLLKEIFQEKKNLLSIFFTAGFPKLDDTTKIIHDLSENGVDFIEVGLPYSDPLADGTTIQDSSHRALQNGMNLDVVFEQLKSVKDTNKTPLVL
ncbi:tryptophan synthase subunit alpha, partial [Tenacibaculum finnmarkense]